MARQTIKGRRRKYGGNTGYRKCNIGREAAEVMPVIDELMTVLEAINPRLYAGVMRKLKRQS